MPHKNDSYLKLIKDYLPLIYIMLVCFGYFEKSLYFDKFGIDILNYMSIPEMILIFIPLGSIIFTSIIFIIIVVSPGIIFNKTEYESKIENQKKSFNLLNKLKKTKNKTLRKIAVNFYHVVGILVMLFLHFIPILLMTYIAFSRIFEKIHYKENTILLFISLWGILFLFKFLVQKKEFRIKPRIVLFTYSILVFIFFIGYLEINANKANNILKGKSNYYVKFKIEDKTIESTKDLLFFGQTNEYIFLRNINTQENFIYKKNIIKELIIRKQNTVANNV